MSFKLIRIFIILSFSLFFFSFCNQNPELKPPTSIKGQINLENWNFIQNGNIPLNGEWEFYFEQFLTSEDIAAAKGNLSGYLPLPGTWKNFVLNEKKITGHGFGTFRLVVRLPIQRELSLKTGTIFYNTD